MVDHFKQWERSLALEVNEDGESLAQAVVSDIFETHCFASAMSLCAYHALTMRVLCAHHNFNFQLRAVRDGSPQLSSAHSTRIVCA